MQAFIDYIFIIYITLIENQVYTTYINFFEIFSLNVDFSKTTLYNIHNTNEIETV